MYHMTFQSSQNGKTNQLSPVIANIIIKFFLATLSIMNL